MEAWLESSLFLKFGEQFKSRHAFNVARLLLHLQCGECTCIFLVLNGQIDSLLADPVGAKVAALSLGVDGVFPEGAPSLAGPVLQVPR